MDEAELGGNDSSDEDYTPEVQELPSEEESDGEPEDEGPVSDGENEAGLGGVGRKRSRSNSKRSRGARKPNKRIKGTASGEEPAVTEEDSKKKTDSLWADFLKDTTTTSSSSSSTVTAAAPAVRSAIVTETVSGGASNSKTVTVYEFAGEEVIVNKPAVPARAAAVAGSTSSRGRTSTRGGGGLSSVLGQLGKKQKISTLEKSKLDWDRFKQDEDIVDELTAHNKGRHGYLERQDFLERADQRQFELEKELRTKHRSHRL